MKPGSKRRLTCDLIGGLTRRTTDITGRGYTHSISTVSLVQREYGLSEVIDVLTDVLPLV